MTTIENIIDSYLETSHDRPVMDHLMTLRFMHNTENVVFLGPPGVGRPIFWSHACNHVRYSSVLHISHEAGADAEA